MMLNAPVLFLIFNRPKTAGIVFEAIRQARPARLYIASDGPRDGVSDDWLNIEKARMIATQVDWDCEVKTLFRSKNLGCKRAVSGAISWFFSHEEDGIVLEDDCVPNLDFFYFCQALLEKYRDDTRIMAISGNNFQDEQRTSDSYYFSRYPHCWGWATWKRAWSLWDGTLTTWAEVKERGYIRDIGGGDKAFVQFWTNIFDRCYKGEFDSWAYPWTYSCWINNGLTILPSTNLVSNIGFGDEATHTKEKNDGVTSLPTECVSFPLKDPILIVRDYYADKFTDKKCFGIQKIEEPTIVDLIYLKIKKGIRYFVG